MEKYENRQECPIGVFDSGVGGISVLRELVAQMPNENYIFFGDSKNAPYGTKTLEEVQKLTCADAEYLLSRGVKALVVACNTATSAAIRILREKYAGNRNRAGIKASSARGRTPACSGHGNTDDPARGEVSRPDAAV
mgnify:CR=1 FL=1